jgi:hypothetical protein
VVISVSVEGGFSKEFIDDLPIFSSDNSSFPIGQNIRFLYGAQKDGWEGRVIRDWFLEYDAEFDDQEISHYSHEE